jgi:exodeoxyribonuclease I
MNYLIYDTETTGTSTEFDQILQFAAIIVDEELNEIETIDIRCQIQPHVIADPTALLVTNVHPSQITDDTLSSHYDFIKQIKSFIETWSPAIIAGYNSLAFDEPLIRQAFYQNLFPTYLTNTKGNVRADVLRMAHACHVHVPGILDIPINDKGKPTFKLDQLAPLNGFAHENAHDALDDVLATLHIMNLIKSRAPELWEKMMNNSSKLNVTHLLETGTPLCLSESHFGNIYRYAVAAAGSNPNNPNEYGVVDLQHDPIDLLDLTVEELVGIRTSKNKRIRTVKSNTQPILMELNERSLNPVVQEVGYLELERRASLIISNPKFCDKVRQALAQITDGYEVKDYLEGKIFNGFPSREDQQLMEQFHNVPWARRYEVILKIDDVRMREAGCRLIYQHEPSALPMKVVTKLDEWCNRRLLGPSPAKDGWCTISKALVNLETARSDQRFKSRHEFLNEIQVYLDQYRTKNNN